MSTKTHLAGAYRRARLNIASQTTASDDIETYTYAAGDVLLGQEGWALSSMHESASGATSLRAAGRWDHPLHRGSWHRIAMEWCELTWSTGGLTTHATFTLNGPFDAPTVAVASEGRTTRHAIPPGTLLVPELHACFGPMIETMVRTTVDTGLATTVALPGWKDGAGGNAGFDLVQLSAQRLGREVLETPDGAMRADEYTISAATDALPLRWTNHSKWFVGGDGLLAGYTDGDAIVWRAASAPSRA